MVDRSGGRLQSIDALRGFDMFWVIGGDTFVHALAMATGYAWLMAWSVQLTHVAWSGINAYDLIFPLFIFLSGFSLSLSMKSGRFAFASDGDILRAAGKRALLLVILGWIYNLGWSFDFSNMRFPSVLGQIGLTYFLAACAIVFCKDVVRLSIVLFSILALVAHVHLLVPVPGVGSSVLLPEASINGWIDQLLLPGKLGGGTYDPEGLFAILSASALTIAGVITEEVSATYNLRDPRTLFFVAIFGALLISVSLYLSPYYPIIKALWTTTFVLFALGASLILLAVFVLLFDLFSWHRLGYLFAVIGTNSILIYMLSRFVSGPILYRATEMEGVQMLSIAVIATIVLIQWIGLRILHERRIFLRV